MRSDRFNAGCEIPTFRAAALTEPWAAMFTTADSSWSLACSLSGAVAKPSLPGGDSADSAMRSWCSARLTRLARVWPLVLQWMPRPVRANNLTPSSVSSDWMERVTAGWDRLRNCAARATDPASATAAITRSFPQLDQRGYLYPHCIAVI